jgi:hypothetical protein
MWDFTHYDYAVTPCVSSSGLPCTAPFSSTCPCASLSPPWLHASLHSICPPPFPQLETTPFPSRGLCIMLLYCFNVRTGTRSAIRSTWTTSSRTSTAAAPRRTTSSLHPSGRATATRSSTTATSPTRASTGAATTGTGGGATSCRTRTTHCWRGRRTRAASAQHTGPTTT